MLACRFLERRGHTVVGRNVRVAGGEIDLVTVSGLDRIAVEVKTRYLPAVDPIENFTDAKRQQVKMLSRAIRPRVSRVDFIGVAVWNDAVHIRWVPAV